ncbi:TPA: carbon storage regulator CsrA [Legionella pneumophila]|nr:carbon storage regulator CsrA [Legionella pneumophila]
MLVLSRRKGEALVIGDAVHVTVLSIKGNQVRIGIDAPLSIPVHREEIQLKRQPKILAKGSKQDIYRDDAYLAKRNEPFQRRRFNTTAH